MVYGVTQIDLPSCDWGRPLAASGPRSSAYHGTAPVSSTASSTVGDRTDGCGADGTQEAAAATGVSTRSGTFVAGPENRLAVPAVERLLADDDLANARELFNPLVLLGPTGTGKSHLARGITRRWQALLGESAVEYMTAIDFARQLRDAREEGRLDAYREYLAGLQLLVIEDLERLPTSLFVQRELRDTLDVLIESGAATVLTALQPPAARAGLESGLRDRLASGLTVRLQPPGVEARLELLKLTARTRGYQVSDQRLRQLAQRVEGTVPQVVRAIAELELSTKLSSPVGISPGNSLAGNSTTLGADAKRADTDWAAHRSTPTTNTKKSVTTPIGRSVHSALTDARPSLELKQIIAVVARYFSLSQATLRSSARRKSLVHARGTAIYLARSLTDLSYAQIGQVLGRRDHSTIIHAARSIERKLVCDAGTQQDIEELKRILTAV